MLNDYTFEFYVFKIPMKSCVAVSLGDGILSEPKRFFFAYSPS